MQRSEIITELKKYFDIRELVCPHTYNKFGKVVSWQFLDTEILHVILVIRRDILKIPMQVNNWHKGGIWDERGLRCNLCETTRSKTIKKEIYLSAHCNGAGIDFVLSSLSAADARKIIKANQHLLPYPIRLESNSTWVHVDIYDYMNGETINYFEG